MKVQNNIMGKGTEDISDSLTEIFETREEDTIKKFPSVLIAKYEKNEETGKLERTLLYGQVKTPVFMYNECDEGASTVQIATKGHKHYVFLPDGEVQTKKGDLTVPAFVKIIDAEKYIAHEKKFSPKKVQLPELENTVNMYVGKNAFETMQRIKQSYSNN